MKYLFTTISCVVILLIGAVIGYLISQSSCNSAPPIDPNKKGASVLVLGCIDPRFANALGWHLTHSEELHMDYDLFTLAGASLGVVQDTYPHWGETFENHVDLAIKLHNIEEVWAFDHMDCGMYKATLGLKDDNDPQIHVNKLQELQTKLKKKYPTLGFRGYIMGTDSSISWVV
jgi:carbonic anhydrase